MLYLTPKSPRGPPGLGPPGEKDPAIGVQRADQRRDGRSRENAAFADKDAAEAVRRGDLDHDLDRLAVEKAPVAAKDQRLALKALERIENRLNEVFEIEGLLEDRDLFAQTRSAGPLVGKRLGGALPAHRRPPSRRRELPTPG